MENLENSHPGEENPVYSQELSTLQHEVIVSQEKHEHEVDSEIPYQEIKTYIDRIKTMSPEQRQKLNEIGGFTIKIGENSNSVKIAGKDKRFFTYTIEQDGAIAIRTNLVTGDEYLHTEELWKGKNGEKLNPIKDTTQNGNNIRHAINMLKYVATGKL